MNYYVIKKNPEVISLSNIPEMDYNRFYEQTVTLLAKYGHHCLNYFVHKAGHRLRFFILVANDDKHEIYVYSHLQNHNDLRILKSITSECFPMHVFEREISENFGIEFTGHPWLKPLRYPHDRFRSDMLVKDYPFYSIESEEVHEVGVGPIHAGVIEPGHFRFICHGENVLHLEIQLGYQHRAVEKMLAESSNMLRKAILSEAIAGDTAIGHGLAFSQGVEALEGIEPSPELQNERIIALELERIAMHIGDTAALCGDVGYQIGQAVCEALRTIVINTTQDWCGNRFGKGLVRPGGTNYPLSDDMKDVILKRLAEVQRRYNNVTGLIFGNSGIISRFENTGTVSSVQAKLAGAVGMAARTSELNRDIRLTHPFQAYRSVSFKPSILESGDVMARATLRKLEVESSINIINNLLFGLAASQNRPDYNMRFSPESLCVSLIEGWRGEICHCPVTDADGNISQYKIKDPSLHNWYMLALSVRGQEISDFPLCNKSFNLSYCGHDL